MQQLFYMTADGRLKDLRSSTEYEANAWPGRIVAICPRQLDETVDEFRYLAIVELLAIPVVVPAQTDILTARTRPTTPANRAVAVFRREAPLSVQRTPRLWFQCSHA
jgi:hypothetical protein